MSDISPIEIGWCILSFAGMVNTLWVSRTVLLDVHYVYRHGLDGYLRKSAKLTTLVTTTILSIFLVFFGIGVNALVTAPSSNAITHAQIIISAGLIWMLIVASITMWYWNHFYVFISEQDGTEFARLKLQKESASGS